jgi:hypothetical protein
MLPAGKKERQKRKPSCGQNPYHVFFVTLSDIPVDYP